MLARTRTLALHGVDALPVDVEIDIHRGLPAFSLVGLPDAAVRESRERVRAAIVNSGFEFPLKRITANLAPADLRKAGPGFDLAIAAAILGASGQLAAEPLWDVVARRRAGPRRLDPAVPGSAGDGRACSAGGAVAGSPSLRPTPGRPASSRASAVAALRTLSDLSLLVSGELPPEGPPKARPMPAASLPDLADLKGQRGLRRGLEVAAAGGHGALVIGPPGAGKSLAARRLPSILPSLELTEAIEVTKITSVAGRPVSDGTLAASARSGPRTTRSHRPGSSVEVLRRDRGRSPSPIMACSSSTSSASSHARASRRCGNRSRTAR